MDTKKPIIDDPVMEREEDKAEEKEAGMDLYVKPSMKGVGASYIHLQRHIAKTPVKSKVQEEKPTKTQQQRPMTRKTRRAIKAYNKRVQKRSLRALAAQQAKAKAIADQAKQSVIGIDHGTSGGDHTAVVKVTGRGDDQYDVEALDVPEEARVEHDQVVHAVEQGPVENVERARGTLDIGGEAMQLDDLRIEESLAPAPADPLPAQRDIMEVGEGTMTMSREGYERFVETISRITAEELNQLSREQIQAYLENEGFACMDSESTDELREAMRQHLEMEGRLR